MAAARVLGPECAAKWVLTPPPHEEAVRLPAGADEVLVSHRAADGDNRTLVAEAQRAWYRLDDVTAAPAVGWGTALRSMRPGERAAFRFVQANETEPPSTLEVELHAITRVEDLSPARDVAVLKTVLEPGSGAETPSDGARVAVELTREDGVNGSDAAGGRLELVLGDGTGGEGLRRALMSMTRLELARIRMHPSLARAPLVARTPSNRSHHDKDSGNSGEALLAVRVRLLTFEKQRALEHMSPSELIAHVTALKSGANARFAAGETGEACAQYERALRLLRLVAEADLAPEEAASWRSVQLSLRLNGAACALRDTRPEMALAHSEAALALTPSSTKALFRRGQALQALGRLSEAESAFATVVEREPTSREAHARLAELRPKPAVAVVDALGAAQPSEGVGVAEAAVPVLLGEALGAAQPSEGVAAAAVPVLLGGSATAGAAAEAATQTSAVAEAEEADLARARQMSPSELIAHVTALKSGANARFAAGETGEACAQYERALRLLRLVAEADLASEEAASWRSVQLSLRLNGAACALRDTRPEMALAHSEAALALTPSSTKALFRRGQALQALGRLSEAESAFATVVEREPTSREAHARLAELRGGKP